MKQIGDCKKKTEEIVVQMTECYRNLEEGLLKEIDKKTRELSERKEMIREWQGKTQQLRTAKEAMTNERDEEIRELRKRIDEMSSDFAEMLKDTLTKMQERIEFANKQWEDENDISMIKKFEDMPGR